MKFDLYTSTGTKKGSLTANKELFEAKISIDPVSYTHLTLPTTPYV